MYTIKASFDLDLIVKVVEVAEAVPAASRLKKGSVLHLKLLRVLSGC